MKIEWKRSAIESLMDLDQWRASLELPKIAPYLIEVIEGYFLSQNFSVFMPGEIVFFQEEETELKMVLIAPGKSYPYKVFYYHVEETIIIYLVRHPRQKLVNDYPIA